MDIEQEAEMTLTHVAIVMTGVQAVQHQHVAMRQLGQHCRIGWLVVDPTRYAQSVVVDLNLEAADPFVGRSGHRGSHQFAVEALGRSKRKRVVRR